MCTNSRWPKEDNAQIFILDRTFCCIVWCSKNKGRISGSVVGSGWMISCQTCGVPLKRYCSVGDLSDKGWVGMQLSLPTQSDPVVQTSLQYIISKWSWNAKKVVLAGVCCGLSSVIIPFWSLCLYDSLSQDQIVHHWRGAFPAHHFCFLIFRDKR